MRFRVVKVLRTMGCKRGFLGGRKKRLKKRQRGSLGYPKLSMLQLAVQILLFIHSAHYLKRNGKGKE